MQVEVASAFVERQGVEAVSHVYGDVQIPADVQRDEGHAERRDTVEKPQKPDRRNASVGELALALGNFVDEVERECRPPAEPHDVNHGVAMLDVLLELVERAADER